MDFREVCWAAAAVRVAYGRVRKADAHILR
jgi:hypothetical protein